ncbi:hypothetical protein AGLY_011713, partial [Aphis glycines]
MMPIIGFKFNTSIIVAYYTVEPGILLKEKKIQKAAQYILKNVETWLSEMAVLNVMFTKAVTEFGGYKHRKTTKKVTEKQTFFTQKKFLTKSITVILLYFKNFKFLRNMSKLLKCASNFIVKKFNTKISISFPSNNYKRTQTFLVIKIFENVIQKDGYELFVSSLWPKSNIDKSHLRRIIFSMFLSNPR